MLRGQVRLIVYLPKLKRTAKVISKKGMTLLEVLVVIMIVGILAAVAVSMLQGRINEAKISEGKAIAGSIAVALRAYYAQNDQASVSNPGLTTLGIRGSDLDGTYFDPSHFSWTGAYVGNSDPPFTFTVTVQTPEDILTPSRITLDQNGVWTEIP